MFIAYPLTNLHQGMGTMALPGPPLPADQPNQVYVSVKALCPGKLHLPHAWVFQDCIDQPESVGSWVPTFSFLISHPTKGHAMFDLGLRKVSMMFTLIPQLLMVFWIACQRIPACSP